MRATQVWGAVLICSAALAQQDQSILWRYATHG